MHKMCLACSGPKNPMMILISLDLILLSANSGESVNVSEMPRQISDKPNDSSKMGNVVRKLTLSCHMDRYSGIQHSVCMMLCTCN